MTELSLAGKSSLRRCALSAQQRGRPAARPAAEKRAAALAPGGRDQTGRYLARRRATLRDVQVAGRQVEKPVAIGADVEADVVEVRVTDGYLVHQRSAGADFPHESRRVVQRKAPAAGAADEQVAVGHVDALAEVALLSRGAAGRRHADHATPGQVVLRLRGVKDVQIPALVVLRSRDRDGKVIVVRGP